MSDNDIKLTSTHQAEEFIKRLESAVYGLEQSLNELQSSTIVLGGSFRDANYSALRGSIARSSKSLEAFIKSQRQVMPRLQKKLEEIQMYEHFKLDH